jgi:3-phenylpropionate/trans-cinnamate dioxygenase ferredoxin reductase subunit
VLIDQGMEWAVREPKLARWSLRRLVAARFQRVMERCAEAPPARSRSAPLAGRATAAGLAVGDGIEVGASLETSVPGIFAAGDVASAWHPFYERRLRSEHWANAKFQGSTAGQSMLGATVQYDRIPYFYSDQYDLGMEYTGHSSASDHVVVRGSLTERQFVAFWLRDGRVVAGMNANIWEVAKPIERLIRSRGRIDSSGLANAAMPLDELAAIGEAAGHSETRATVRTSSTLMIE